ncbi:hypothetical protein L208DRAFT_626355 [Tricholoma matsutake]|nr:hypothetical protein L208DRAFT_626355 [Tricholoma matsutake 945]
MASTKPISFDTLYAFDRPYYLVQCSLPMCTKSIDKTVFPVVFGSMSTATMTFITGHWIFSCYPGLIKKRALYGMVSPCALDRCKHLLWRIRLRPRSAA